jgi:hypothetical protein
MYHDNKILIGMSGNEKVYLYPSMANRHGMIAGATGTGKTITLKVLAESFSDCGVPVFLADAKGDLAAMCREGSMNEGLQKRIDSMGLMECGFKFDSYPVAYWDVFGEKGMPVEYGMDLVLFGNIPNSSGLSSSASVEVLTGYILRDMFGFEVTNQDLALIGQYSEINLMV